MKEKVFGVFGLGIFGNEVCRTISEKGGRVIAFDQNALAVEKVKNMVTRAVVLDSTDESALVGSGIEDIDIAVVAIGENIEASILTTALLKKSGTAYIIARAISEIHAQVLKQIGANEVINVEIEEGRRLANRLMTPDILDRIYIGKNQVITEMLVPKMFVGKSILQIDLRRKYNLNVISIKRTQTEIDENGQPLEVQVVNFPNPSLELKANDTLVVVGAESDIEKIRD